MSETSARPAAAIYRGMDRAALDAAYNNSLAVKDSADWIAVAMVSPTAGHCGTRGRQSTSVSPCSACMVASTKFSLARWRLSAFQEIC